MLQIEIDNQQVDVSEDFSFTLVRKSPLFNSEKLTADIATDMNFPQTENNEKVFGFANRLSKAGNIMKTYSARVTFRGRLLISGTAKVTNSGSGYSAYIRDTRGDFNEDNQNKSIKDFTYDTLTFSNSMPQSLSDKYCLPELRNRKLHDTRVPIIENVDGDEVSRWNYNFLQTAAGVVNYAYDDNGTPTYYTAADITDMDTEYYAISPMIFVKHVLETVLNQSKFQLTANALDDDDDMKWLCFLNVNDITEITGAGYTDITFTYTRINPDTGEEEEITVVIGREYTFNASVGDFDPAFCLPDLSVKNLIIGLQNMFNVVFIFNKDRTAQIIDRKAKLLSMNAEDWNGKVSGTIEVDYREIEGIKLATEEDQDDDWVSDYMEKLTDQQRANYQGEVYSRDDLPGAIVSTIGHVYLVTEWYPYPAFFENKSYTDYVDPDDKTTAYQAVGWKEISLDYQDYYKQGETENYQDITSPLQPVPRERYYPVTAQVGNRNDFQDYISFAGRLLFYHGVQRTYHPFASSENTIVGNQIPGKNLSMKWDGDSGLFNQRWKEWIEYLQKFIPISFSANLDEVDISNLNLTEKKRIEEGQFFIEEVRTPVSVSRIGVSDVTARFIPNNMSF